MRGSHFLTPVSSLSTGLVQLPPDERHHQLSFQLVGTSCPLVCFLPTISPYFPSFLSLSSIESMAHHFNTSFANI